MPGKNQWFALVLCALGLLPACGSETNGEGTATEDPAPSAALHTTGYDGGMFFTSFASGGGTGSCTPDGSNGYRASWSNVGDFFCGKGWNPGSNRTVTWSGTYNNSGAGSFGLYGWTTNPLVEYYVVEKAGQLGSPAAGTPIGEYASDGSMYRLYRNQRVNQPCITGNACTFWQYVAVRQTPRTSGTITVRNHFDTWASLGLRLGMFNYEIVLTEAWGGATGSASVKIGACCGPTGPGFLPQ